MLTLIQVTKHKAPLFQEGLLLKNKIFSLRMALLNTPLNSLRVLVFKKDLLLRANNKGQHLSMLT